MSSKAQSAPTAGADYLNERDAAAFLGVSRRTLYLSRFRGRLMGVPCPPPHLKVGQAIRYRRADLVAWIEGHAIERRASAASLVPAGQ